MSLGNPWKKLILPCSSDSLSSLPSPPTPSTSNRATLHPAQGPRRGSGLLARRKVPFGDGKTFSGDGALSQALPRHPTGAEPAPGAAFRSPLSPLRQQLLHTKNFPSGSAIPSGRVSGPGDRSVRALLLGTPLPKRQPMFSSNYFYAAPLKMGRCRRGSNYRENN